MSACASSVAYHQLPPFRSIFLPVLDRGWQQKDLREATGLSQKYLSEVELDKVDPRFSIVKRIAHALQVSLDQLAREEDTQG